jgi:hypothetical protein
LHSPIRDLYTNCTLNLSERNPDQPERQLDPTAYLCYSVAAILMLQYVIIAVTYGPSNANSAFLRAAFFSYFLIFAILVYLGSFEIQKGQWLSLLRRKAILHHQFQASRNPTVYDLGAHDLF